MTSRLELTRPPESGPPVSWTALFWEKRRFLMRLAAAGLAGSVLAALLFSNRYTAQVVILPSGKQDKLGILGGLAGSLGFDMAGSTAGLESSSLLYPDILKSRLVGEAVLTARYRFPDKKKTVERTLLEHLGARTTQHGLKKLAALRKISMDVKTGIITLEVTTTSRELSALVANQYVAELERYNRQKRKTKALNNLQNVEQRLDSVKVELAACEKALEAFLQKNRNFTFSDDPELNRELAVLKREVAIKGETYATLTQQRELAKIEVQKEIPIVQVLDYAVPPQKKSGPKRMVIVLSTTFFALAAGLLLVFVRALLEARFGSDGMHRLVWGLKRPGGLENRLETEAAAP